MCCFWCFVRGNNLSNRRLQPQTAAAPGGPLGVGVGALFRKIALGCNIIGIGWMVHSAVCMIIVGRNYIPGMTLLIDYLPNGRRWLGVGVLYSIYYWCIPIWLVRGTFYARAYTWCDVIRGSATSVPGTYFYYGHVCRLLVLNCERWTDCFTIPG